MKLSAILEPLIAAGVPGDVILATVRAFEGQQIDALEKRRESDRQRQAKHRSNVTSRDVTVTVSSRAGATRGEDNLLTKELAGKEERKQDNAPKARGSDLADFKTELSTHLDAERIEAIVKHRRSKRGQITGLSARLFLADAATCGLSPADAVDTCISRNWITVKPEYLNGHGSRSTRSTGPPRGRPTAIDAYEQIAREKGWTSEPAILPGDNGDGERLSPERNGPSGAVVDLRRGPDGSFGSVDPGDGEALHRRRHS